MNSEHPEPARSALTWAAPASSTISWGLHPLHRFGFGLLGGEVAFIATTLIVIDVTLAALFWSWGADDDIIARLVKTLFVGVFAYIIGNWNSLAGSSSRLRQPPASA